VTAQVAADLRAAADVLRRDGWMQGDVINQAGHSCALGALAVVSEDREHAAYRAFRDYLGGPIGSWNDKPGRTADEVIAALEAAAAEADK
jgi:hypothetical protein